MDFRSVGMRCDLSPPNRKDLLFSPPKAPLPHRTLSSTSTLTLRTFLQSLQSQPPQENLLRHSARLTAYLT